MKIWITLKSRALWPIVISSVLLFLACPLPIESDGGESLHYPAMVNITEGSFTMGNDSSSNSDEKPEHTVNISSFSLGKYEVTHTEYIDFLNSDGVGSNGSKGGVSYIDMADSSCAIKYKEDAFYFKSNTTSPYANCPASLVTWYGAEAYCNWLSTKTGDSYRLPTESEWEYAVRGGNANENYTFSGGDSLDSFGWYSTSESHRVGLKTPNSLGLYDMSGNNIEWCQDFHDTYSSSEVTDPTGPGSGTNKVLRGGSWKFGSSFCTVTYRYTALSNDTDSEYGFRVARE